MLESAAREPVRTVLSGPAGGVVGASAMARLSSYHRIISFDMGGTSTDVALVDGEIHATNEAEVAGLPVRVPMLDIHTVGAGGGSIARFDAGGALRVGPESAGADPGPICYGKGEQPTVTDANLLLGRLRPEAFLGGQVQLDLVRTRSIVAGWLRAQKSSLSVEEFAAGVLRVVNATMEKAIRVVSVERGYDPRDFTLVAFGGAGGLHACELASALGIPRVIVPSYPGALSAFGILVSDVIKDYSRTVLKVVSSPAAKKMQLPKQFVDEIELQFRALREQAERDFASEGWSGKLEIVTTADVRYRGQGFELNIPWGRTLPSLFASEHKRRYGYADGSRAIEIVTLRLRARLKSKTPARLAQPKKSNLPVQNAKIWLDGKPSAQQDLRSRVSHGKSLVSRSDHYHRIQCDDCRSGRYEVYGVTRIEPDHRDCRQNKSHVRQNKGRPESERPLMTGPDDYATSSLSSRSRSDSVLLSRFTLSAASRTASLVLPQAF